MKITKMLFVMIRTLESRLLGICMLISPLERKSSQKLQAYQGSVGEAQNSKSWKIGN